MKRRSFFAVLATAIAAPFVAKEVLASSDGVALNAIEHPGGPELPPLTGKWYLGFDWGTDTDVCTACLMRIENDEQFVEGFLRLTAEEIEDSPWWNMFARFRGNLREPGVLVLSDWEVNQVRHALRLQAMPAQDLSSKSLEEALIEIRKWQGDSRRTISIVPTHVRRQVARGPGGELFWADSARFTR